MKLLRHGAAGAERPGLVDADGRIRDLSGTLPDLTPEWLVDERLDALRALDVASLPVVEPTRFGVPVAGIRQVVGIGLNYRHHAIEAGMPIPEAPIVFFKAITSLTGPDDGIVIPKDSSATDWEIELAIVIGRTTKNVSTSDALSHVAGYAIANDVSERDWQLKRSGGQWSKGKGFDTFCPLGPWLVTRDEVDPDALDVRLRVNGDTMQQSSTADMIFGPAELIARCSEFMTLMPGDVILTGTPQGVAMGMKPPRYLKPGDVVELDIAGLGRQRQRARAFGG